MAILLAALVILVAALTILVVKERLADTRRIDDVLREVPGWVVTLAIAFVLLMGSVVAFETPAPGLFLIALGAVLMLLVTWFRDFAYLMTQPDHAFPGRYDKLIWAFLLIVLPPVGVVAFWSYRRAQGVETRASAKTTASREWL